jgi:hypothetical protein
VELSGVSGASFSTTTSTTPQDGSGDDDDNTTSDDLLGENQDQTAAGWIRQQLLLGWYVCSFMHVASLFRDLWMFFISVKHPHPIPNCYYCHTGPLQPHILFLAILSVEPCTAG